jgi:hypothetical protein
MTIWPGSTSASAAVIEKEESDVQESRRRIRAAIEERYAAG